ncbi:MAG: amino acid permease [Bacteroidetes bacterium]|nr:amino acid permease [Bacteroidota bacterium]MDA1336523.1 amino acid permease [Bacteroidota bacterium]
MSESNTSQPQRFNRTVALNMVIGNMVGTGVFTSIGFQVKADAIPDPFTILVIWIAGGALAFCGALSYAEVATTYPKSGGEYSFLSRLYHPVVGLMSGWVSIVVGFSAAIAALAKAAASYLLPVFQSLLPAISLKALGTGFIALAIAIQFLGNKQSGKAQILLTSLKLAFIAFLIVSAWTSGDARGISLGDFSPNETSWGMIGSAAFAGSLVWVMYAYSGWNASTYIVEQLVNPRRDLIASVLWGTVIVTVLYALLNASFLHVIPMNELAGKMDPGNMLVESVFSKNYLQLFSLFFGLTLLAGMNAMFIAGPRVAQQIGKDYPALGTLGFENSKGVPTRALGLISAITIFLFLALPFETIVEYTGVTLSLFSMLTVTGVFIIRIRKAHLPTSIKAWGYPITPLIFIGFSLWMIWFFVRSNPWLILWSLITLTPAIAIYFLVNRQK